MKDKLLWHTAVIMLFTFISLAQAHDLLQNSNLSFENESQCPYLQYMQYFIIPEGENPINQISDPAEIDAAQSALLQNFLQKRSTSDRSELNENTLWIQGIADYSQYVIIPKGSIVALVSASPNGGNGSLNEIGPGSSQRNFAFSFYPQSQLIFYAEAIGKYTLSTVIGGNVSNNIEIDVIANCTMGHALLPADLGQGEFPTRSTDVERFPISDPGQFNVRGCDSCK